MTWETYTVPLWIAVLALFWPLYMWFLISDELAKKVNNGRREGTS